MQTEFTRISNKNGVRVILLNLRIQRRLWLRGPNCIVVSGKYDHIYPIGEVFEEARELAILRKKVGNRKMTLLTRIDPNSIDPISTQHEILHSLR